MNKAIAIADRPQTWGEEIANSISHGVGLLLSIAAVPILVTFAAYNGGVVEVVSASIFTASMVLVYLTSTLYHALPYTKPKAKDVFRLLDHALIFLLIAGSYTPFALCVLGGSRGWTIFGIEWGLAIFGICMKLAVGPDRFPKLSNMLYLAMGWLGIFVIEPMWAVMPAGGLALIFAGGMSYTIGILFFVYDRIKFCHFVWHLFVVGGTTCHFIAAMLYAM